MDKYGFLGLGNMAKAMIEGLVKGEKVTKEQIYATSKHLDQIDEKCQELGIHPAYSNKELAQIADIIFICVKPEQVIRVTRDIKDKLKNKIVINIAPGIKFSNFTLEIPRNAQGMCIVPNIPVAAGKGIFIIEDHHNMKEENLNKIIEVLESAGDVLFLPKKDKTTAVSITGGGPAIVAMAIEAFADALVKHGLSRKEAYKITAATFSGTSQMMIETGIHPAALKDEVTPPGGSTIQGIAVLEEYGFRNAIIHAIDEITKRNID
ncbi:MAG: pyrroline-5-carboxylate reductase [Tissierellia bacterium]|nr:pyrroline-5-carboxylate reductase [Tissierellia bacterium]